MKQLLLFLFLGLSFFSFGQTLEIGKSNSKLPFDGSIDVSYTIQLKKGSTYLFTVHQNQIDVEMILLDSAKKQVAYTDLADGNNGYDKIDFFSDKDDRYQLIIRSVEKQKKADGSIEIFTKKISQKEIDRRKKIVEELKQENIKQITTSDITRFWEAYDRLSLAKTNQDSINIIQTVYLDRATDGLKEFQKARYFAAELFVERIGKYKKFYQSVRENTKLPLQMGEKLSSVLENFKRKYPNATPAKICFVVGPMSTGGTISNHYLLLGTEMIAGSKDCDVSEITNENLKTDILSRTSSAEVNDFIVETAVHEYVHTQQKKMVKNACDCPLLENVIKEGVASYISEKLLLQKKENKSRAYSFVKENEKKLWKELKAELCTKDFSKWLFNAASSKDRPGDLGYRMGYQIAESYYENAEDKDAALKEMIEMDNPLLFLDKSKYDVKMR
jgi:hypothetical protein